MFPLESSVPAQQVGAPLHAMKRRGGRAKKRQAPKKKKKQAKAPSAEQGAAFPLQAVFLDIDGVLLPFGGAEQQTNFATTALHALSTILEACPRAELVLSSTWRCAGGQPAVIAEFEAYATKHGGPLGNVTHFRHTTSLTQHDHRQWEVATWLEGAHGVEGWVALDDEEVLRASVLLRVALASTRPSARAKHRHTVLSAAAFVLLEKAGWDDCIVSPQSPLSLGAHARGAAGGAREQG